MAAHQQLLAMVLMATLCTARRYTSMEPKRQLSQKQLKLKKAYFRWMRESGIQYNPNVTLRYSSHGGFTVFAKKPVLASDGLVHVPYDQLIKPLDFKHARASKFSDKERLALVVIRHRKLRQRSPYFPYIQLLPKKYSNAYSFTQEQLGALEHTYATTLVSQFVGFSKQLHRKAKKYLGNIKYSLSDIQWGVSVVATRAFQINLHNNHPLNNQAFLAPVADMFNHAPDQKADWVLGKQEGDPFRIFTRRAYAAGEEILFHYNNFSNGQLMTEHGFVMEVGGNPHDFMGLTVTVPADSYSHRRTAILQERNISLTLYLRAAQPLPPDLAVICTVLFLTTREFEAYDSSPRHTRSRRPLRVSKTTTGNALRLQPQILQDHLEKFPTTADQDRQLLKDGVGSEQLRQAIVVRLGEKELLLKAIATAKEQLAAFTAEQEAEQQRAADAKAERRRKKQQQWKHESVHKAKTSPTKGRRGGRRRRRRRSSPILDLDKDEL